METAVRGVLKKKCVLRNFTKFTGKHLCQSLFFNKLIVFFLIVSFLSPEPCNFIKKETQAQVFSCQFCDISKNTFFYRTPLDDCFWHYKTPIIKPFEKVNLKKILIKKFFVKSRAIY